MPGKKSTGDTAIHRCSFCGKTHVDVVKLIAGPGVNICADIVAEDRLSPTTPL